MVTTRIEQGNGRRATRAVYYQLLMVTIVAAYLVTSGTCLRMSEKEEKDSVTCPLGFTFLPVAGRCYKVIRESHDWNSAAKRCPELSPGSHLVAIETQAENVALGAFLVSDINENSDNTACRRSDGKSVDVFWTSGQREIENDCESPFVWKVASDTALQYKFTNWVKGEPNCQDSEESCMDMEPGKEMGWNDERCTMKFCPVCECNPSDR